MATMDLDITTDIARETNNYINFIWKFKLNCMNTIMIDFLAGISRKLHCSYLFYNILKPFYHKKLIYDDKTIIKSYETIKSLYNNIEPRNSCITAVNNIIASKPKYDVQIIIPAYNAELYIKDCINSVLLQKTKYNYYITIINDGSTDTTGDILNEYLKYTNIAIINQENKGFSGARNSGLKNIIAKYIMFLDSDDQLAEGAIEVLLDKAARTDADIVEGGNISFRGNRILGMYLPKESVSSNWLGIISGVPWGKIIKASKFENIQFPENYWFEDTLMSMIIYPQCKYFATINSIVYKYRKNYSGITQTFHKNIKTIDTYWITEQLIRDHIKLNLVLDTTFQSFLLIQLKINFNRILKLKSRKITEAIFILSISIFEKYLNSRSTIEDPALIALSRRDISAFMLTCKFLA